MQETIFTHASHMLTIVFLACTTQCSAMDLKIIKQDEPANTYDPQHDYEVFKAVMKITAAMRESARSIIKSGRTPSIDLGPMTPDHTRVIEKGLGCILTQDGGGCGRIARLQLLTPWGLIKLTGNIYKDDISTAYQNHISAAVVQTFFNTGLVTKMFIQPVYKNILLERINLTFLSVDNIQLPKTTCTLEMHTDTEKNKATWHELMQKHDGATQQTDLL